MLGNNKLRIQEALGPQKFNEVYTFLKLHRAKGTDDQLVRAELQRMVNGRKDLMSHCQYLDGIVYMEMN